MLHEQVEGGSAALIALYSGDTILLVRDRERSDPKWKLMAETMKPGESILHTLKSGLEEEAGMKDIKTELGADGKIARFVDDRIISVVELGVPTWIDKTKIPHWRHLYGVKTTNAVIDKLSGCNNRTEEPDGKGGIEVEDLETMKFPLVMLVGGFDGLLRQHAELVRSIPKLAEHEIK